MSNIASLYQMVRERVKELDIKIATGTITKNSPVDVTFCVAQLDRAPFPGISIQKLKYRGKIRAGAMGYFLRKKWGLPCADQK